MALCWLRLGQPGFHECHTICGDLRAGKDPLRPTSALMALELASVALYFPRSQSGALSQLHLPFCCWTALLAPCIACAVPLCLTCGRRQPFFTGQGRTWHGSCRMVSDEGSCWRAAGLPCSGQGQLRKLTKLCTWIRLVLQQCWCGSVPLCWGPVPQNADSSLQRGSKSKLASWDWNPSKILPLSCEKLVSPEPKCKFFTSLIPAWFYNVNAIWVEVYCLFSFKLGRWDCRAASWKMPAGPICWKGCLYPSSS